MAPLTRRRFVVSGSALAGITTVAASTKLADATLVVADADSSVELFEIAVNEGEEVTIEYIHSVQKTPVKDVYIVERPWLRSDRSVFYSFGAGLPTENVERTDEGYVVEGSERHEELYVVPGRVAGHELVVDEQRYDLVDAADGKLVLFVTDRTWSQRLTGWTGS